MKPSHLILLAGLITPFGTAMGSDHKAHEHGVGQMNIAQEDAKVEIELTVPGADAVGFEHPPATAADHGAIEAATARLKDATALFQFPAAAQCRLVEARAALSTLEDADGDNDHSAKHEHENAKHEKEHKDEHRAEHKGEHGAEDEDAHSAFSAYYRFHCADPKAADGVEVRFFDAFPTARELDANIISDNGQSAIELTPSKTKIRF